MRMFPFPPMAVTLALISTSSVAAVPSAASVTFPPSLLAIGLSAATFNPPRVTIVMSSLPETS